MTRVSHGLDHVEVIFDEPNLVANAGLMLVATLTGRLGLEALIDSTVRLVGRVGGARPGRKVLTLVHAMIAGASHIDHADMLRAGSTASVLGHRVMAPSTLGTFLRAFTFGHVRQLEAVVGRVLERAWAAGAGPGLRPLERCDTKLAGLLLAVPELVALDLPGVVAAAGYPGTRVIPAVSSVLSLLALKLTGTRRVSHVDDPAAGLFAGLAALPKATALTTYSYRLTHERQRRFLAALDRRMLDGGLAEGGDFDLDFHAVMHWGEDAALEKHYVPRRSQRTRSVLTFFAQDAGTHNLVYANADISKAHQAREVLAFCDHWRQLSGTDPTTVVLDQRVTTHDVLAELDTRGVRFITLRMRSVALVRHIDAIDPAAWHTVSLDRDGNYRKPQVVDEQATITGYPGTIRQLIVRRLGRETATVIITNDRHSTAKQLIERYARRMTIDQRLAEAIRSFHLDALAGAVPLNVDLDVVLSVLAGAVCASLRRRLGTGYTNATPDTLQRRFLHTSGTLTNHGDTITIRLNRRTYTPVLRSANIPDTTVPWWGGRTLHFDYA